ncbi:MAG: hypothetical protein L6R43_02890 [Planctomycetes bacterium]|nr:hypothetical protein [Planctomycetota bacterium]
MGAAPGTLERFRGLVERCRSLSKARDGGGRSRKGDERIEGVAAFQGFLDRASELALRAVADRSAEIREIASLEAAWAVRHDLLAEAGLSFVEDAYTNLLAWMLRPATHPASALRRQTAFLSQVWSGNTYAPDAPTEPLLQVWTEDGIPDLVLQYPSVVFVVEAKTGSEEHETPDGDAQTVAYPSALRKRWCLSPDVPAFMALLSPDGRRAASPDAVSCSYLDVSAALMRAMETEGLDGSDRVSFGLVFTHWIGHATPLGDRLRPLLARVRATGLGATAPMGANATIPLWQMVNCLSRRA